MVDSAPFCEGRRLRFDGALYTVVGLDGHHIVRLKGEGEQERTVQLAELLAADDFQLLAAPGETALDSTIFEKLPEKIKREAFKWRDHLRDVWPELGVLYEDGSPAQEASEKYDSALPVGDRLQAKQRETDRSRRHLYNYRTRFLTQGNLGLVDQRELRQFAPPFDDDVRVVVDAVIEDGLTRSRRGIDQIYDEVAKQLAAKRDAERAAKREGERTAEGEADVYVGEGEGERAVEGEADEFMSLSTFRRKFALYQKRWAMRGPMKYMRSAAQGPAPPYRRSRESRYEHCFLIDTSPYDIVALDDETGLPVHFDWTVAMHRPSRSIVASRFTPRNPKGVDAALILYESIVPKLMQPNYPDAARWNYLGVPEEVVFAAANIHGPGVAAVPLIAPQMVAVDRGRMYISQTFQDACAKLGIDMLILRKARPTDKSELERWFGIAQRNLLSRLPGFKGSDVYSRGADVEGDAVLFIEELRDLVNQWIICAWQPHVLKSRFLPGTTSVAFTPNRMYEEYLARWGFNYVPPPADLYYDLLDTHWCVIRKDGVQANRLLYDDYEGHALNEFRNTRSPYNLIGTRKVDESGKWPIKIDPRDRSHAFFRNPNTGEWHTLTWVDALGPGRGFNDVTLAYARSIMTGDDPRELARTVNELIDRRVSLEYLTDRKERILAQKQRRQDDQRRRDLALGPLDPADGGDRDLLTDLYRQIERIDSSTIRPLELVDEYDFDEEEI